MAPFEPKGDEPEWRLIYRTLKTMSVDDIVTFEELDTILGRPFRSARAPLYAATRVLETDDSKTLDTVRGRGYRVCAANEHERLAVGHQRRARRQVTRGRQRAASADRTKLTQAERERIDQLGMTLVRFESQLRKTARRVEEVDELRKQDTRRSQSDIAAMAARLETLEARLGVEAEADQQV